jgi:hypothetical protein
MSLGIVLAGFAATKWLDTVYACEPLYVGLNIFTPVPVIIETF